MTTKEHEALSTISALKMCLEYIETNAHERRFVRHAIKDALAQQDECQHGVTDCCKECYMAQPLVPEAHKHSAEHGEPVAVALHTGTKQGIKWYRGVEHGTPLYTSPPNVPTVRAQRQSRSDVKPLTDEEYTALAHRIASKYAHRSDLSYVAYTFLPHTLEQFVRSVEAKHGIYAPAELEESE